MTKDQATALRERLLTHRTQLIEHATRQSEVDPNSLSWIHTLAHVQLALAALDDETGRVA